MAFALRIRRRLWVAFAAIAVSLPATAGASTEPRCEAMPAGCTTCACCKEPAPASPQTATAPVLSVARTTRDMALARPASSATPCVCRAEAPTAPAPKPGDRVEERRVETSRGVVAEPSAYPGPGAPVAIAFMPDVGPPRSPLYLRNARLLI